MDAGLRHVVISDDDHGPLLGIVIWFLGSTMVLCTATRLGVRFATRHLFNSDDFFILAAAVLATGGIITASFSVKSGLGRRSNLLTPTAIEDIQKEIYAATILYVLTIGISKASMTTFLARLVCTPFHKTIVFILTALVACWTATVTIGVVFQCALPRPWAIFNGKCIPMLPFWVVATAFDILADFTLILLPINVVFNLQIPSRKKVVVILIFTLRTLLIGLSISRVILLDRSTRGDVSFDSIPYAIVTQAHSSLSVIVACSPALKPFMENVRTGMLSASLAKRSCGRTIAQDSWGAQIGSSSNSALWTRTSTYSRESTACTEDHVVYLFDTKEKNMAGSNITNPPPMHISAPFIEGQISYVLGRAGSNRTPPRPPPPPEELRPDLSFFQPKPLAACTKIVNSEGHLDKQSAESQVGIVKNTSQPVVRVEGGCI